MKNCHNDVHVYTKPRTLKQVRIYDIINIYQVIFAYIQTDKGQGENLEQLGTKQMENEMFVAPEIVPKLAVDAGQTVEKSCPSYDVYSDQGALSDS